mgnify:CR=1 FL=1
MAGGVYVYIYTIIYILQDFRMSTRLWRILGGDYGVLKSVYAGLISTYAGLISMYIYLYVTPVGLIIL